MAARVPRGGRVSSASRLPGPDPPSTNSAWHQQLYGARSTADYDRGRRQVRAEQGQWQSTRGGVLVSSPRTATKDTSGYARSWCTQKSNRVRLHVFVLDYFPRSFAASGGAPFSRSNTNPAESRESDWACLVPPLCSGCVMVSKETVRRVGIGRCQSRIEAEPRRAVGTKDRVRLAHIDIDVRMVLRG